MKITNRVRLMIAEAILPDSHMVVRNFALRPSPSYIDLEAGEYHRKSDCQGQAGLRRKSRGADPVEPARLLHDEAGGRQVPFPCVSEACFCEAGA